MGVHTRISAARQGSRPSLGLIEIQRRTKLHVAIRNIRTALDHPTTVDRSPLRDRVAPLVAQAVCEIAVLDRETDATAPSVINMYANLIALALGFEDEAWEAIALWQAGAGDHLAQFDRRWTEHKVRAEQRSESRYHHRKVADLDGISATLGLTRPRIRVIFGDGPCALPPTKMRPSRFTPEEAAEIRALAKRTGYTREWIGDMVLSLDPEAFSDLILARELQRLPDAVLDRNRTLPHIDDQQLSRSVRKPRWRLPSKPGPKPRADTLRRQIEAVARLQGRSPKTIERWRCNLKASDAELTPYETPESSVAVRDNSCRDEEQFVRSVNPLFATEISPDSGVVRYGIKGVEITDPWLLQIARIRWYDGRDGRRKTYAHLYTDWDLIIRWHVATYGFEPKRKTMHKWAERGILAGFAETARQWEREMEIQASDAAKADHTTIIRHGDRNDDYAARPVREPDHAGDFADLAPYSEQEGADADART